MCVCKKKWIHVIHTIFGKKKRQDQGYMQSKGIRQHLWLIQHLNNQHKILKLHALYVFTLDKLNIFLARMGSLKLPIDYGTSSVKHVVDKKLNSMKSHDYHMLMQHVLPCACKSLWWWNHRRPLWALIVFSTKFVWRFGIPQIYCKSMGKSGDYIYLIEERISSILLWYDDTFIITCSGWARSMWASS